MRAPSAYPMGGAQEMVAKNIRAEGKKMKKRHRDLTRPLHRALYLKALLC